MGRMSLWAELRYWVCSLNPFIRRTFGLALWASALGLYTYCFRPHHFLFMLFYNVLFLFLSQKKLKIILSLFLFHISLSHNIANGKRV